MEEGWTKETNIILHNDVKYFTEVWDLQIKEKKPILYIFSLI